MMSSRNNYFYLFVLDQSNARLEYTKKYYTIYNNKYLTIAEGENNE
jgi:hypothetical protein